MHIALEVRADLLDAPAIPEVHAHSRISDTTESSTTAPAFFSSVIDEATLAQLWHDYKIYGSNIARTQLIVYYMAGYVRRIAERLRAQLPRQVEVDDLTQYGYVGLVRAIERFDPERGVRFETFASTHVSGAMRDYLREIDEVPRLTRSRFKQLQKVRESYYKTHGREPTPEELRAGLKLSARKFKRFSAASQPASVFTFSAAGASADGGPDTDAMSAFEDRHSSSPLTKAEREDLKRWVTMGFSRRDRLIIILYYYEQMTMKDVGLTIGCSESRVSQRLESILNCLRARLQRLDAEKEFLAK
jgi:RNA polymerase sigma factor for flagellar operon FliA